MLELIGTLKSRSFRPAWLLEELGLPYTHRDLPPRSEAVHAVNPSGKIPVLLTEEGTPLTDSTAILTWLSDREGRFSCPPGSTARARQDAITHFLLDELDACLWTAARHSFVLPEERRLPAIKDSLRWEYDRGLERLSRILSDGRAFLAGDTLTVPDIIAVHCGNWAHAAGFAPGDDVIAAYMSRLRQRPAYRAVAVRMAG
ncbi:glutathione S-transferase family protein [Profundibacterium mesophilum]|uniref:Glutathione S-transferase n=1 Tax=Profundibacterium mesophilum KAUST100406-0324 TaxID=1037889 RepID=A0A921NQL9_9RHOB|nr:glutathione S-transferase family protein [Profundibacterium mesophilum]KAF0676522.1 Glutathione S-transferase [Profundibacterium mesophilum KAUST100406-0324]